MVSDFDISRKRMKNLPLMFCSNLGPALQVLRCGDFNAEICNFSRTALI